MIEATILASMFERRKNSSVGLCYPRIGLRLIGIGLSVVAVKLYVLVLLVGKALVSGLGDIFGILVFISLFRLSCRGYLMVLPLLVGRVKLF